MAYSGKPLPRVAAAEAGVSAVGLQRFISALDASHARMRGFVLLRHGKVAAENYWAPYRAENKNWVYSISKSFTSTAFGFAYDAGLVHPDDKALSFFPELDAAAYSDKARDIRLRDLLTMTSGHDSDPTVGLMFNPSSTWEDLFFKGPIEHEPGTYYVYNSAASYLLSSVLTRVTGSDVYTYLTPRLFEPLGFGDSAGDTTEQGVFAGGWGMMVCLEDLAKLGQLYLNRGLWEGKRLLSEDWVQQATAFQSNNGAEHRANEPVDWRQGYGFQFWRCQHNSFRADGAAGQYCVVMPEQGAVIAIMSECVDMQEILDIVWSYLLPAIDGMASPQEEALRGKSYRLSPGADGGMKTAQFLFSHDALQMEMHKGDNTVSLQSGRGAWRDSVCTLPIGEMTFTPMMRLDGMEKKVSSHFYWQDAHTLVLVWVYLETPHSGRIVCRFRENTVAFHICPSLSGTTQIDDDPDFTGEIET